MLANIPPPAAATAGTAKLGLLTPPLSLENHEVGPPPLFWLFPDFSLLFPEAEVRFLDHSLTFFVLEYSSC